MIVNMKVRRDKNYRIFYSTEQEKYIMGCIDSDMKVYENFFRITEQEYDSILINPNRLDSLAGFFSNLGLGSPRFLGSTKKKYNSTKEQKKFVSEMTAELKESKDAEYRDIAYTMSTVREEEQVIRNDFHTLCLIAKINSLAKKFKDGAVPFSELSELNYSGLAYDDIDPLFENDCYIFYRPILEVSADSFGYYQIESYYDEGYFCGMECFLIVSKEDDEKYIQISMSNECEEIVIDKNGDWYIE